MSRPLYANEITRFERFVRRGSWAAFVQAGLLLGFSMMAWISGEPVVWRVGWGAAGVEGASWWPFLLVPAVIAVLGWLLRRGSIIAALLLVVGPVSNLGMSFLTLPGIQFSVMSFIFLCFYVPALWGAVQSRRGRAAAGTGASVESRA